MKTPAKIFLATLSIIVFGLPIIWVILLSFKSPEAYSQNPLGFNFSPTLDNYREVLRSVPFFSNMMNSVFVTVFSVLLTIALAAPAGYSLSRHNFKGKKAIHLLILLGLTVPIHVTLFPILKGASTIGLYDSLYGLGIVYASFGLAITFLIMKNAFDAIPKDIFEAARMDGSSEFRTFFQIALPLAKPSIAVAMIYNCVMNYNEYAFALILLTSEQKKTLPLTIADFASSHGINVTATAAAISLAVIPVFLVFLFTQKFIISGITAGALKG